ncbi:hypothetical protein Leryth_011757 [Lithospermum erythrorhizon]|nr:hypothetical protein Leryth_011757 [Lithospermum erythrorhizon]
MVVMKSSKPPRNRGFYVKMKLIPTSTFCFRYFKWFLWLFISFYFFISFLITHKQPSSTTSLSKTTLLHHPYSKSASNALIESLNTTTIQNHPTKSFSKFNSLKIYIYNLPNKFNEDWLANKRCTNHLFASEVAIHKALLNNEDVRTLNFWDADLFFVPVYVSCNFSTVNGFPAIGHARQLLTEAVHIISSEFPFWNRSHGSDHIFVASHDYGACFHAMEDRAKADGIPEFMKNSIMLQTFGVKHYHPCQDVENVVVPPYVSPESIRKTLAKTPIDGRRDIFAFFRGKMELHPKNISGRFYSKKVRTVIWKKYGGDRRFYLKRHRFAGYQSEIVRSKFCLCPLGWAPWSPRLVESVVLGCVPVIIADGIRLPFSSTVSWAEISLTVAESDVDKLGPILEHVMATNFTSIQRKLWDSDIRNSLLFNNPMVEGDATWHILESLSLKVNSRSIKRARLYSQ